MAYTDDEFQVLVTGRVGPSEVWANTWTILDVEGSEPRSAAVAKVRGFYNNFAADHLSSQWHADAAMVKSLDTGLSVPAAWETFAGGSGSHLLPTQLCARISLNDQNGHNGGPYVCGFTEATNSVNGVIEAATKTVLVAAIDAMASGLVTDGFQLRIDRPSVESTVPALQARVGSRWDVIRRRANDVGEDYTSVSL